MTVKKVFRNILVFACIAKGPKEQEAENAPFITALNVYFKMMLSNVILM